MALLLFQKVQDWRRCWGWGVPLKVRRQELRIPIFLSRDFKAKMCKDAGRPWTARALVKAGRDLIRG